MCSAECGFSILSSAVLCVECSDDICKTTHLNILVQGYYRAVAKLLGEIEYREKGRNNNMIFSWRTACA